jgi:hypothetical protein
MITDAYLSNDRKYRYWLFRQWDASLPVNCTCGINPSTADERENDPTIRKDIGFSERMGFGGLLKLNVAAYRSTDPKQLELVDDPVGEENSPEHLRVYYEAFGCAQLIACWGRSGNILPVECRVVLKEFESEAVCFGLNSDGTPRHTVRLSYDTPLIMMPIWGEV